MRVGLWAFVPGNVFRHRVSGRVCRIGVTVGAGRGLRTMGVDELEPIAIHEVRDRLTVVRNLDYAGEWKGSHWYYWDYNDNLPIRYVHELQTLVRDIEGRELEFEI